MNSDFNNRFMLIAFMVILVFIFTSAEDGYCTTSAAIAIGKDEAYGCKEYWFNRYQGLIGAIATLIAAIFAYRAVSGQINQNETHARDRKEREAYAARAVLPLSLSAICDYAGECMRRLDETSTPDTAVPPWPKYEAPTFPNSVIASLQDGVRHSERVEAKKIADLIASAQIQASRMRDLTNELENSSTAPYRNLKIQQGLLDAADLYARAATLFAFARGEYTRNGTPPGEMRNALAVSHIIIEEYPILEKIIESYEQSEKDKSDI